MQDSVGAPEAGVPEGAMDRLGYSESPFFNERQDPFPSHEWYFTFHTITATHVYLLRATAAQ